MIVPCGTPSAIIGPVRTPGVAACANCTNTTNPRIVTTSATRNLCRASFRKFIDSYMVTRDFSNECQNKPLQCIFELLTLAAALMRELSELNDELFCVFDIFSTPRSKH